MNEPRVPAPAWGLHLLLVWTPRVRLEPERRRPGAVRDAAFSPSEKGCSQNPELPLAGRCHSPKSVPASARQGQDGSPEFQTFRGRKPRELRWAGRAFWSPASLVSFQAEPRFSGNPETLLQGFSAGFKSVTLQSKSAVSPCVPLLLLLNSTL